MSGGKKRSRNSFKIQLKISVETGKINTPTTDTLSLIFLTWERHLKEK